MEEIKQQWMERVCRMYHHRLLKQAADYRQVGRRFVEADGCGNKSTPRRHDDKKAIIFKGTLHTVLCAHCKYSYA